MIMTFIFVVVIVIYLDIYIFVQYAKFSDFLFISNILLLRSSERLQELLRLFRFRPSSSPPPLQLFC